MNTIAAQMITAALSALCGVALGAWMVMYLDERSFARAARFMRTGKPEALKVQPSDVGHLSASPEASAVRQVTEDAVRIGVEQVLANAKEQGVSMTRKEAEQWVRSQVEGSDMLGGAH